MNFEQYNKDRHFEILKKWYMDYNILKSMEIDPMSEADLANWLDVSDRIHLVFFDNNAPIGCVNFYHYKTQFPSYELGYLVDDAYRGKGLATEMVKLALQYAKDELQIKKIEEVYVAGSNLGSKRVLEKNGFVLSRYNNEKDRYYFNKEL